MRFRWPFMTKARHQSEMDSLSAAAADAVDREYLRATKDGQARVHAWARNAASNVFHTANSRSAAQAAFQQAEAIFSPEPLSFAQFLSLPHDTQEVLANARSVTA